MNTEETIDERNDMTQHRYWDITKSNLWSISEAMIREVVAEREALEKRHNVVKSD